MINMLKDALINAYLKKCKSKWQENTFSFPYQTSIRLFRCWEGYEEISALVSQVALVSRICLPAQEMQETWI